MSHDQVTTTFYQIGNINDNNQQVDEIKICLNYCYIFICEATWWIFFMISITNDHQLKDYIFPFQMNSLYTMKIALILIQ